MFKSNITLRLKAPGLVLTVRPVIEMGKRYVLDSVFNVLDK